MEHVCVLSEDYQCWEFENNVIILKQIVWETKKGLKFSRPSCSLSCWIFSRLSCFLSCWIFSRPSCSLSCWMFSRPSCSLSCWIFCRPSCSLSCWIFGTFWSMSQEQCDLMKCYAISEFADKLLLDAYIKGAQSYLFNFFQTFGDFAITRKLIFFHNPWQSLQPKIFHLEHISEWKCVWLW